MIRTSLNDDWRVRPKVSTCDGDENTIAVEATAPR
jgi:hypothetical protein